MRFLILLFQLLLLSGIFLVTNYLFYRENAFDLIYVGTTLVVGIPWLISVWLTHKHRPKFYQRKVKYVIAPFHKAGFVLFVLTWPGALLFIDDSGERMSIYYTTVIYFIVEEIVIILALLICNSCNKDKKQDQGNLNKFQQEDIPLNIPEAFLIEQHQLLHSFKLFSAETVSALFNYGHSGNNAHAPHIQSLTAQKEAIEKHNDACIIDFRINDVLNINQLFKRVYENLKAGGFVLCVYKDLEVYEEELTQNRGKLSRFFVLLKYYIVKRAFPKIPYFDKLYFFVTRGKNKVISKAEVWGRLFYAGFEVEKEICENGLSFVIARKTKTPSANPSPSYYPVITLNRVSLYGNIIKIHKVRSMSPYSEFLQKKVFEDSNLTTTGKFGNDFRITKLGRIYRKYWIDELPQFFDWFRGEIKFVGIRAMSQHFFSLYPQAYKDLYFKVKPGIISPIFDEKTDGFEQIVKIEQAYLEQYLKSPVKTDFKYFFITLRHILSGVRSK